MFIVTQLALSHSMYIPPMILQLYLLEVTYLLNIYNKGWLLESH